MNPALADDSAFPPASEAGSKPARPSAAEVMKEVADMSRTSIEQEGLLSYVQGAMILGVTPPRVAGLARDGVLTRFDFLGRPYVSLKEVCARRKLEVKAGRPKRGIVECLKITAKAYAANDLPQWEAGTASEFGLVRRKKAIRKQP